MLQFLLFSSLLVAGGLASPKRTPPPPPTSQPSSPPPATSEKVPNTEIPSESSEPEIEPVTASAEPDFHQTDNQLTDIHPPTSEPNSQPDNESNSINSTAVY